MLIQLVLVLSTISLAACDRVPCGPCASAPDEPATVRIVTPMELQAMTAREPKLTIVDANPREVFDKGHVPGARWMATDELRDMLPADRSTPVVFYCYSEQCGASHAAAKEAIAAGWTNVARMSAGIQGWRAAGLPIEK